jgi:hypothetical protein
MEMEGEFNFEKHYSGNSFAGKNFRPNKKVLDFPVGESNPGLPRSEQTAGRLTGGYTDHYTNREMDEM